MSVNYMTLRTDYACTTVYAEIFTNFAICSYWRNFYRANILSCVNDYIEDMATFTALAKIYSTEYLKFLSSENFVVYGITALHAECGSYYVDGMKDLWCSSAVWLLSTQI